MPGNRPGHRRPDGTGHLALDRRRNRWRASISIAGERHDRMFADEESARRWLDELRRQTRAKGAPSPGSVTVGQWFELWLKEIKITAKRGSSGQGRALKTLDEYEKKVRRYIMPTLGEIKLRELKPEHIIEWRHELTNPFKLVAVLSEDDLDQLIKPISNRTINTTHIILGAGLQMAVDQQIIGWNPAKAVRHLKIEKQSTGVALPLEKWQRAVNLALDRLDQGGMLVLLAGAMGMRLGEALAVKWTSVYETGEVPYLECGDSLQRVGRHGIITTPGKNKWSRRVLPIPPFLVPAFQQMRQPGRHGYVVEDPPRDPGRVEDAAWHPIREELGAPTLRLHDLRHTLITHLETQPDLNELAIKMFVGHAPTGVTPRIYTHVEHSLRDAPYLENVLAVTARIERLYYAEPRMSHWA